MTSYKILTLAFCFRTCNEPIAGWQFCFYFNLLSLRVLLYLYCISIKLAKCAMATLMFFLMPMFVCMTIAGTIFYRRMRINEPACYPDDASPWSLILCLSLGWFLTYIYLLLGCSAIYNKLEGTRVRFFFSIFTHLTRNDPLITRLTQNEDDLDNENGVGNRNDIFEPLNQNGEIDESFNPLSNRELTLLA